MVEQVVRSRVDAGEAIGSGDCLWVWLMCWPRAITRWGWHEKPHCFEPWILAMFEPTTSFILVFSIFAINNCCYTRLLWFHVYFNDNNIKKFFIIIFFKFKRKNLGDNCLSGISAAWTTRGRQKPLFRDCPGHSGTVNMYEPPLPTWAALE